VSPVYIKQVNVTHVTIVQPAPSRPVMYANTRFNGGVTVVSSDVLTRRQAVAGAARPADPDVIRAINRERGGVVAVAPPAPSNASFAPRAAVPVNPAAQPRIAPPGRGGAIRAANDSDDSRGGRLQQSNAGDPRGGFGGQVRQPETPAARAPSATIGHDERPGRGVGPAPVQPSPAPQGDAGRPRVARPPVSNSPSDNGFRQPGQPAQAVPQPRREADVQGFPAPREAQRERDARESPQPRQHQQQAMQPMPSQPQAQPQPQPRAAPREVQREDRAERQRDREDRQDKRDHRDRDNR
jgi:hypothetical protein